MKKNLLLLILIVSGFGLTQITAKTELIKVNIQHTLSSNDVETAAQITFTAPGSGKVLLHFDGYIYSSEPQKILLAANNSPNWLPNDGQVTVNIESADRKMRSFSHTRIFNVTAGDYTFYAVGKKNGSVNAAVYGTFTMEFFPEGDESIVSSVGISQTFIDVNNLTTVGQTTINCTATGKAYVRFDGYAHITPGDRINFAASDEEDWDYNAGHVGLESTDDSHKQVPFAHTRVYTVNPGEHTFYAVAQVYGESAGDGITSIYANLSVVFIPDDAQFDNGFAEFVQPNVNLENIATLASVTLNPTSTGQVIVNTSGMVLSDPGDRIIIAASDDELWHINDGAVAVFAVSDDVNRNSFSHTRVYDVTAGSKTFYCVAQNYVNEGGSGIAHFHGMLTAMFIPNEVSGIHDDALTAGFNLSPNPVTNVLHVEGLTTGSLVSIFTMDGKLLQRFVTDEESTDIDTSDLGSGIYVINITNKNGTTGKKFVK